jgi:hypothetical protein
MNMEQTIKIGQVAQPSPLSQMGAAVKSLKQSFDRKVEDSEFCQVLGITSWHFSWEGVKVTVAVFLVLLVVCGLAEWLEGGAA